MFGEFSQRLTLVLESGLCVSWQLDYHFFHPAWKQSLLILHSSICHSTDEMHMQCIEVTLGKQKLLLLTYDHDMSVK